MIPPGPSVWTVMVALLGVHVAAMGAFLTTPVLAPAIAAETGLPASLAGLHTALVYAGALVSGPFTGLLLKRFGGIRVCQGALVTLGAGIALSTIGTPAALAASALVAGLGHGPVTPAGSHLLASRVTQRRRSLIFSLKQTGVPGGAMLVAAIAPAVATLAGWRAGAWTIAGLALAGAVALQPIRAAVDAERERGPLGGFGAAWRDATGSLGLLRTRPALRWLTFAAASLGIAQFCFGSFFVVMQTEQLGRSLAEAGLAMALAQAGGVVGRVTWGFAADRVGPVRVLMGLALAAACASAGLALAAPGWPAAAVALAGVAMGASAIGWNGVLLGEAARVSPAGQVGGATAALGVVFGLAMLAGPPAFSALVVITGGYGAGFALCAASCLAALAFLRAAARAISQSGSMG